jgi:2-oxoglutarate ferredoxin oxidoreductase subunit alpha
LYNILIGGAAGQGIETAATILEKILKRNGYNIFTTRDYMSRIRGGHNFIQVCFGEGEISTHVNYVDGMIALTDETFEIHKKDLIDDGFVICDSNLGDSRQLELHMNDIAKKAGNLKASVSVAVGAVLKMFGIHIDSSYEVFKENVKKEFLDSTFDCAKAGYDLVSQKFTTKAPQKDSEDRILINGNQAIALGAMTAGLKFYSAYPMTPSTSIMDFIAENMQKAQIVVEQAEDEIAGINMAIGASYAGARAMTGTSGGGFCLKVEGLGLAGMLEVPLVIANIMRPGPATGLPTRTEQSDLRFVISASQGEFPRMVISLRNPEDSYYQTIRAFNLAEKYQIPVILLGDQYLADTTRVVKKFDVNKVSVVGVDLSCGCSKGDYKRYKLTDDGISPRLIPGKCENCLVLVDSDEHDEYGRITESAEVRVNMVEKRLKKTRKAKE